MGSEVFDIVESDCRASAGRKTRNFDIDATASFGGERRSTACQSNACLTTPSHVLEIVDEQILQVLKGGK